jgi:hypothetical protein
MIDVSYCFYSNSHAPFSLGNVCNPSDNLESESDTIFFGFLVTVPADSSGSRFRVSARLTFNNTVDMVNQDVLTRELVIILPTIANNTDVSKL